MLTHAVTHAVPYTQGSASIRFLYTLLSAGHGLLMTIGIFFPIFSQFAAINQHVRATARRFLSPTCPVQW